MQDLNFTDCGNHHAVLKVLIYVYLDVLDSHPIFGSDVDGFKHSSKSTFANLSDYLIVMEPV